MPAQAIQRPLRLLLRQAHVQPRLPVTPSCPAQPIDHNQTDDCIPKRQDKHRLLASAERLDYRTSHLHRKARHSGRDDVRGRWASAACRSPPLLSLSSSGIRLSETLFHHVEPNRPSSVASWLQIFCGSSSFAQCGLSTREGTSAILHNRCCRPRRQNCSHATIPARHFALGLARVSTTTYGPSFCEKHVRYSQACQGCGPHDSPCLVWKNDWEQGPISSLV